MLLVKLHQYWKLISYDLGSFMERLRDELMGRQASPLFVQGIAQAIAIHLARNYALMLEESLSDSPSLPGYKLRQITDWMAEHVAEDPNLDRLAAQAGLSKFHFHRLFRRAMAVSPARYHINLRMNVARRLLPETNKSVVDVALDVGYTNPSHFAKLFRRETGLAPSDYRRQRLPPRRLRISDNPQSIASFLPDFTSVGPRLPRSRFRAISR